MCGVVQLLACWARTQRSVDRNHAPLNFGLPPQKLDFRARHPPKSGPDASVPLRRRTDFPALQRFCLGRPIPSREPEVPLVGPELNFRRSGRRRARRRWPVVLVVARPRSVRDALRAIPAGHVTVESPPTMRCPASNSRSRMAGRLVSSVSHPLARSGARLRGSGQRQ